MRGLLRFTLIVACVLYIKAQSYHHEFGLIEECGDSTDQDDFLVTFDNELVAHMDFKEKQTVITLPDFIDPPVFPPLYEDAKKAVSICREVGSVLQEVYANSSKPLEPPWSSIYSKSDVRLNVKNILICHVTGFFPPPVRVSWTKNNLNMTDDASLSRYYPNKDGSMNVFSRLSFIPEEGDIYSCSVEHKALQEPQTRIWEVEIKESSIGPSVFCGVGVALGLLGLITAAFLFAKGKNCN